MTALPAPPSRVQQVYDAIVDDICTGRLTPGTPLRQEHLAERFSVSRQPVQQALLLLRNQGMLRDFGRRGLEVAPVDADFVRHLYGLRAVLDGYAARSASGHLSAEEASRGFALVAEGQAADREKNYARMVAADIDFHRFVTEHSGNPLLVESAGVIWRNVQRVMGELLFRGSAPKWVWEDHAAIFSAVVAGDGDRAERLAREHAEHGETLILDALGESGDAGSGRAAGTAS
ncbi:putative transcriptional regulatory protein, GntR family [Pseudonocardia sp. Ae168_Ps1]|uniref:GntR family transcriptional regulator n=1 Tax=unclassified Pseudonocardia TaxID=2619320 RepID=UPI0001FFDC03|nr:MULTISPECIES: GntR family transcriptional regulator [unclassified Pseudonocardia]ALE72460.1 GntR family transcriptional regulator [Pseudonocardia sp. EC080625-04]ALL75767.1 GntR family transcriptional regulator [Pseudonocardia sp. EC080610-09]ALL82794.1 GntR family transcriptional regulator [Pseudonocardia sp. EC080619-01]OLL73722.1 putative transcriptional regulatory protein, GntR family [Pseudonocardia sp. Ae150A_Ps1]OLL79700.1 putative transcriptional regulatory protein, GntR family [Pse